MSDWVNAIKEYEHEFFPERYGMLELVQSLTDTTMPADTRARIASEIIQRPAFSTTIIEQLKVEWWGDENPTGCRLAWEALEAAR